MTSFLCWIKEVRALFRKLLFLQLLNIIKVIGVYTGEL